MNGPAVNHLDRPGGAGSVVVLCYHAVSAEWEAPIAVTPMALKRQVNRLLEAGYAAASFTRAILGPRSGRTLVVTFDDAYRSVREHAFPILSQLGVPGTVFAPTSFIGSERPMSWEGISQWAEGPHRHELVPMSWAELGELAESGWEIGSHTHTHPRLPALPPTERDAELKRSRRACEQHLGTPCISLAYPYGKYDRATMDAARDAGYQAACALARYVQRPEPMAWPRVGVYHGDDDLRFRIKVSPLLRRLRASWVWHARVWAREARNRSAAGS